MFNSDPRVSNFRAIEELETSDSDLVLLFLAANDIAFSNAVSDPWYSAHLQSNISMDPDAKGSDTEAAGLWYADNTANVVGCTQQVQYCNPNLSRRAGCSRFMSLYDLAVNFNTSDQSMWRSSKQKNLFFEFVSTLNLAGSLPEIVNVVGVGGLTSRRSLISAIQGRLPDNQWQSDIANYVSIMLAGFQRQFVEWANGPKYTDLKVSGPTGKYEEIYCKSQVSPGEPI